MLDVSLARRRDLAVVVAFTFWSDIVLNSKAHQQPGWLKLEKFLVCANAFFTFKHIACATPTTAGEVNHLAVVAVAITFWSDIVLNSKAHQQPGWLKLEKLLVCANAFFIFIYIACSTPTTSGEVNHLCLFSRRRRDLASQKQKKIITAIFLPIENIGSTNNKKIPGRNRGKIKTIELPCLKTTCKIQDVKGHH